MANQRMFIRCMVCGDEKFLAKRMISSFYTYDSAMFADGWDDWFSAHKWGLCKPEGRGEWGLDCFQLSYETHIQGRPDVSDGGA